MLPENREEANEVIAKKIEEIEKLMTECDEISKIFNLNFQYIDIEWFCDTNNWESSN